MVSPYQVYCVRGHYEVRDAYGTIVVTGDTQREVEDELIEILANMYRNEMESIA